MSVDPPASARSDARDRGDRQYLSRSMDYLGNLGARLRDLQGYSTLVHELIQNADDASGATAMTFDVRDEALFVDNDGVFTDCEQPEMYDCPWKPSPDKGHMCDFHRFRRIGSGDKRSESETTGAFGIGFISVLQITDRPELVSADRHWTLAEERPEAQRIEVCTGCPTCRQPDLPGTRFIFPWARDAAAPLRLALRAEPVPQDVQTLLLEELRRTVTLAMLFLRRIRAVTVRQNGRAILDLSRVDEAADVRVFDRVAGTASVWRSIRSEFTEEANALRKRHPGIEAERNARVVLAIPMEESERGLLCAGLPTEEAVGLPFHVNADFFPTNDRKRILLQADYQSEWNRAALGAAARSLATALPDLPLMLGAERLWRFLEALSAVADRADGETIDPAFTAFWDQAQPRLAREPVVWTTTGTWVTPADACLLLQSEEAEAIPVLEGLGIVVADECLRPHHNILRKVGVRPLDIGRISPALEKAGLDKRTEAAALPAGLESRDRQRTLWGLLARLRSRQRSSSQREEDDRQLRALAIAPGADGALWPCAELLTADSATSDLFRSLPVDVQFVRNEIGFSDLFSLCRSFDVDTALSTLQAISGDALRHPVARDPALLPRLFRWLDEHIQLDDESRSVLAELEIYPSRTGQHRPLAGLALPGEFDDVLGLAELVDLEAVGGRRDFLKRLGIRVLDFPTYSTDVLPQAIAVGRLTVEQMRRAVTQLAGGAGRLKDDQRALRALKKTALIECTDGVFRVPGDCHFDSPAVRQCLGEDAAIAVLPHEHEVAVRDLFEWLGVPREPRMSGIVARVEQLSATGRSAAGVETVAHLMEHLITRGREYASDDFIELRRLRWLPARGRIDRWYRRDELFAVYQDYLFESQGPFLDVPRPIQNRGRDLLEALGVQVSDPPPALVVRHLRACIDARKPVNREVYTFLNRHHTDPSIASLVGIDCLLLTDGYKAPARVFWGEHPFGRYRWRLGDELLPYRELLTRLGVRDTPGLRDALDVLGELSVEFGESHRKLDDEAEAILASCWRLIDQALDDEGTAASEVRELRSRRCIPNQVGLLQQPDWMFFENRAGLAEKFGSLLKQNVIPRPLGATLAYTAAGVRPLASVVEIELLECSDPAPERDVATRVMDRRNEIGRVVASQYSDGAIPDALARLDTLRFTAVSKLEVRYRFRGLGMDRTSHPEPARALYRVDVEELLLARTTDEPPWASIAREMAYALFPDDDPGRLAAGLKEVVAPATTADAAAALDDLGFPLLDTQEYVQQVGAVARSLGDAAPAGGVDDDAEVESPEALDASEEEANVGANDRPADAPSRPTLSDTVPRPETQPSPARERRSNKHARPVLRSYVVAPDGEDDEPDPDSASAAGRDQPHSDTDGRSAVDVAGVSRVLEYESRAGRIPREMPHSNPGYDIESRDDAGRVVRYIEVKSFSGEWHDTFADLSRPQFEMARELGDTFWLYVVERAESEDFEIRRIQNPALTANHFMFDDGWSATAESDTDSPVDPVQ